MLSSAFLLTSQKTKTKKSQTRKSLQPKLEKTKRNNSKPSKRLSNWSAKQGVPDRFNILYINFLWSVSPAHTDVLYCFLMCVCLSHPRNNTPRSCSKHIPNFFLFYSNPTYLYDIFSFSLFDSQNYEIYHHYYFNVYLT